MTLNKNDSAFLRTLGITKNRTNPAGRPKGVKDRVRRQNPRYLWSTSDLQVKFQDRVHVARPGREECWIWTGASSRGVGYMVIGSRQDNDGKSPRIQAHRLSYILHLGELERRDLVAQKCDNRLCVNPRHLYTWRR